MADDDRNDAEPEDGASGAATEVESELERTRKLILERRNRFMAAALAGIGLTAGQACTRASVCLSFAQESAGTGGAGGRGSAGTTTTEPCPGRPGRTPPCVCLSAPFAGTDRPPVVPLAGTGGTGGTGGVVVPGGAGAGAGGSAGTRPIDCPGNAPPCVCLSAPYDDAGVEEDEP